MSDVREEPADQELTALPEMPDRHSPAVPRVAASPEAEPVTGGHHPGVRSDGVSDADTRNWILANLRVTEDNAERWKELESPLHISATRYVLSSAATAIQSQIRVRKADREKHKPLTDEYEVEYRSWHVRTLWKLDLLQRRLGEVKQRMAQSADPLTEIRRHRARILEEEIEPSDHDRRLWAILEET